MKEIDDTALPESESEYDHAEIVRWIEAIWTELKIHEKNDGHLNNRIKIACDHIKGIESTNDQRFKHLSPALDHLHHQLSAQIVSLVEMNTEMNTRMLRLEKRVAHLETQRTPEMENDDPEWFS